MITPMALQDSVCNFLEKEVAPLFMLKSVDIHGGEIRKHPQVVRSGWILPKSIDDEDYSETEEYPYIAPRVLKLQNIKDARESVLDVNIMFGVYDPGTYDENKKFIDDGSGYRDFWNLVETVRQKLFTKHTLDNKFRLHDDFFEAELIDVQIYPYWEGFCKTKWDVAHPPPRPDESFF